MLQCNADHDEITPTRRQEVSEMRMYSLLFLVAVSLLLTTPTAIISQAVASLCRANEQVFFNCNRELEVLALMSDGLSNTEIGNQLFISPKTVGHHVSAILEKLEARTRAEAVAVALQSQLLNKNRALHNSK